MAVYIIRDYEEIINISNPYKAHLYVDTDRTVGSRESIILKVKWNKATQSDTQAWNNYKLNGESEIELPANVRVGGVIAPKYQYVDPPEHYTDRFGNIGAFIHDGIGDNTVDAGNQFFIKYLGTEGSIGYVDINRFTMSGIIAHYKETYPEIVLDYVEPHTEEAWVFPATGTSGVEQTVKISINIPLFKNNDDLIDYLNTGDLSNAITDNIDPEDVGGESDIYYWEYADCTIGEGHKILSKSDESTCEFKLESKDNLIAWVLSDNNQRILEYDGEYVFVKNGSTFTKTPFSQIETTVYDGNHNTNKYGDLYTNIPRANSLADANNQETIEPSYNGEDAEMDLTSVTIAAAFCHAYYVSGDELSNISKVLYASDVDLETALKKGLWMYGEDPINCVIDLCYYPFDLSPFISNQMTGPLKFGSYYYTGELSEVPAVNYSIIRSTNTPFTMVNQRLIPIYNDFRDYTTVNYSLFLPYYGIMPVPEEVIGKNLTIKVFFDVYTSQMKYYLFSNNTLLTVAECTVGRHISVMGSSWLTKSGQNINDFANTYKSAMNAASSLMSWNAFGAASSLIDGAQSFMSYLSKPDTQRTGSTTSGMNIYDPMSIYLITEQFETIKPAKLNTDYGKPVYKIDAISSVSGYVVVNNPKLKTHATSDENSEIIELLAKGIII